ncbi:hypothetical protein QQF64_013361 [Cirrhinus molitorella]|uniref:Uncharacterized protein n=1 Tax=Cirrhinus molitorella TaxID=172907 RepID=A0ABR3LS99_9TELE
MHEMAEKASQTFPTSRILVSTLLPRLDFPPSVIDKINEEVRHSCSSLPNVHLVHHSSIRPWHLYDGLHAPEPGWGQDFYKNYQRCCPWVLPNNQL